MKRMLFALAILILIGAGCVLCDWHLTRETQQFTALIDRADTQAELGNREEALETLQQLQTQWEEQTPLLGSLIRHAEMDQAEQLLSRAQACLRTGQLDAYYLESDSLRCILLQIDEMESLSLQNIF